MTTESNTSPEGNGVENAVFDTVIRLAFLGLLAYWAGLLISPFVVLVVWAVILAVAVYPVYHWLRARLGGRGSLASLVITLIGLAIILGPTVALMTSAAETAQILSHKLSSGTLSVAPPPDSLKEWPLVGGKVFEIWSLASSNLSEFLNQNAETILSFSGKIAKSVASVGGGALGFAISIIIAGLFYGNGPAFAKSGEVLVSRIVSGRGEEFIQLAGATIRNVSRGVVGIAVMQAVLAALGLVVAGIPGAGLIAVAVLILALIQVGPALVLIPVIIWVWSAMEPMSALLFTVYMVPVTIMDNFLKPIIMAKGLKTPTLVIFIGVIGGTLAHGLIGLFLGPIILAIFYELLIAWIQAGEPTQAGEPSE